MVPIKNINRYTKIAGPQIVNLQINTPKTINPNCGSVNIIIPCYFCYCEFREFDGFGEPANILVSLKARSFTCVSLRILWTTPLESHSLDDACVATRILWTTPLESLQHSLDDAAGVASLDDTVSLQSLSLAYVYLVVVLVDWFEQVASEQNPQFNLPR